MACSETWRGANDESEDTGHFMNSEYHFFFWSLYDLIVIENGFLVFFFHAAVTRAPVSVIKGNGGLHLF